MAAFRFLVLHDMMRAEIHPCPFSRHAVMSWNRLHPLTVQVLLGAGMLWASCCSWECLVPRSHAAAVEAAPPHPLFIELSKPGYNFFAAMRAALSDKSIVDVCRLIAQTDLDDELGLLPSLTQEGLFQTYPVFVARVLQSNPEALQYMRQEYAALGELKIQAVFEEQNAAAVEAAAIRYCGTSAAVSANQWLGDRALASGDFTTAAAYYRRPLWYATVSERQRLEQRLRMAMALTGRNAGQPQPRPFAYGGLQLAVAEFEQLVRELESRVSDSPKPDRRPYAPEVPPVPTVTKWQAKSCLRLDVPPPWSPEMRQVDPDSCDWVALGLTATATDKLLILSTRWQISALTLERGEKSWTQQTQTQNSSPALAMWAPFTPLVTADRLFVRRLVPQGTPGLTCLDLKNGQTIWSTVPRLYAASDPWLCDRAVLALTLEASPRFTDARVPDPPNPWRMDRKLRRNLLLQLTKFSPDSGTIITQTPLLRFRDSGGLLPSCRVALFENNMVATVFGVTICTDLGGRTQWVQRRPWTPAEREGQRLREYHPVPLVQGNRIIVFQPRVEHLQCLDIETGALYWEQAISDLRRPLGIIDQRLILQAKQELRGLNTQDGNVVWRLPLIQCSEAFACENPHKLAIVAREATLPPSDGWSCLWLDSADGRVLAKHQLPSALLPTAKGGAPRLGPLIQAGDQWWIATTQTVQNRTHQEVFELSATAPSEKP